MGRPADLFTLDIDTSLFDAGITFPVIPTTPLATFYGLASATFEADVEVGLAMGVDLVVGLDTVGFYLLDDPEPLVRGAAVWALSRLADRQSFLAAHRDDPDPQVAEEWRLGLRDADTGSNR